MRTRTHYLGRPVVPAGERHAVPGAEHRRADPVAMALQPAPELAARHGPELDGLVVRCGHEELPVPREGHGAHALPVALERQGLAACMCGLPPSIESGR